MNHSSLTDYVCYIFGRPQNSSLTHSGVGVFVENNYVLTAAHVVSKMTKDSLTFQSSRGQSAGMRLKEANGRHFVDRELDLALIQLDRLIAPKRARVVAAAQNDNLHLVDMFQGKASVTPVQKNLFTDTLRSIFTEEVTKKFDTYYSRAKVQKGYSGSPLMRESGEIISLTTAVNPVETEMISLLSNVFKTSDLEQPFFAVKNSDLLRFYNASMRRVAERHPTFTG